MTTWQEIIDAWGDSLDRMEAALRERDWDTASASIWSPPAVGPTVPPESTERLHLAELDRRSARAARSITEAMAEIGNDLVDSARRRGAARAYHAQMG